jgi:hypothetical protein
MSSTMAHKVVLRLAKLKSFGNVAASLSHTYRTRETPNAATELADQNTHSHSNPAEVMQALKDRLPEKRRSDAVLGLEYVVTAHQDWFKGLDKAAQDAYLMDSLEWLRKRHGSDNVVGWSIHRDEQAPHLAVYVVPLKDGKLNAKHFTGGKKVLSQLQTDFAKDVGQRHGLERGIEGSQAKHQTIKEFYAQVNQPIKEVQLSAQSVEPRVIEKAGLMDKMRGRGDLVESNKGVADRLTEAVQQAYAPVIEKAKQGDLQARRAAEMARTAETLAGDKKRLEQALQGHQKRFEVLTELEQVDPLAVQQLMREAKERLTVAKRGVAALDAVGGRIDKVDWERVETQAIAESAQQHRQEPAEVYAAMMKHSPASADAGINPERGAAVRLLVEHLAGKAVDLDKVKVQDRGLSR